MALVTAIHLRGTRAAQPAASSANAGYIYCVTDESNILERSSGSAWQAYSPGASGSGTVTNTGTLTSGKTIIGNGSADVTVSSLTAQFVGSSSGTAAAASMTTNRLLGRTTAASGAVEEITPGASLVFAAGALNGRIVQVVNTQTGAVNTGSTTIPFDDTIPQNTEGDEYMTLAITPTNSSNKLRIEVEAFATSSVGAWIATALFQDTTANALACNSNLDSNVATGGGLQRLTHYMTAGTTSSTTFKVRIGGSAVGTTTFNGQSGGRKYGGVLASSITITEISA